MILLFFLQDCARFFILLHALFSRLIQFFAVGLGLYRNETVTGFGIVKFYCFNAVKQILLAALICKFICLLINLFIYLTNVVIT